LKTLKEKTLGNNLEKKINKITIKKKMIDKINTYQEQYLSINNLELKDMFDETQAIEIEHSKLSEVAYPAEKSKAGFKVVKLSYIEPNKPKRKVKFYINKKFTSFVIRRLKGSKLYNDYLELFGENNV